MNIIINPKPKVFDGYYEWEPKTQGVILVEKKEDINPLWELLCLQDDYWESYKHLIKIAPKEIEDLNELNDLCEYCGKTDIYNVKEIQSKIPFIIYQYTEKYG